MMPPPRRNRQVHVWVPALEDSAQLSIERQKCDGACVCCDRVRFAQYVIPLGWR
jgi:hypothetical protein